MASFVVWLIILAIAIFFLGTLFGFLQQCYTNYLKHEDSETAPKEGHSDGEVQKRPSVVLVSSINAITDQLKAERRQQYRHERQRAFREKIIIGVAGAAAFFAGLSAWIFDGQLREMRDEQRAWIAPGRAVLERDITENGPINITISYGNTGKTPAFHTAIIRALPQLVDAMPDGRYDINQLRGITTCGDTAFIASGTIFPSSDSINKIFMHFKTIGVISHDNMRLFLNSKVAIAIYGCFSYKTAGGDDALSPFCYFLQSGNGSYGIDVCSIGVEAK
jgi:hypothetical protein